MIIKSVNDIHHIHNFILNNDKLAFDIETNSLNPRSGKVIGFGVSNATEGFYIVHLAWDGEKLVECIPKIVCEEILDSLKHKKWIGWNGSFEVRFCRHYYKIDLAPSMYGDGMLAKHTVDEERPFQLKEVAEVVFGADAKEEQIAMKYSILANGGDPASEYFKADIDILGKYCIQDCLLTYKLHEKYEAEIINQGLSNFYFDDEVMPLYKEVTIDMEDRGIRLDLPLMQDTLEKIKIDINILEYEIQSEIAPLLVEFEKWYLNKELPEHNAGEFAQYVCKYANLNLPKTKTGKDSLTSANLEKLEDSQFKDFLLYKTPLLADDVIAIQKLWYKENATGYMFNLSSKHHLKKLFFDKLGEESDSKTDKGNDQIDNYFLDKIKNKYKWVYKLIDYNKLNKIKSTYIDRFLEEKDDDIFYPSFFQHRTISGRYGSDLQQLPRPKEDGELSEVVLKYNNIIRKFFIVRDGYKFIDADVEALEPHVFAHVSGDEGLKDIFKNGHDFYSTIAIRTEKLQNVSADKKAINYLGKLNKSLRQKAKAYSLGVPYGMGDYALGLSLNIDQKEAAKLIDDYLNAFPNLKSWMEKSKNDCLTLGYVKSEAGRIRHMPKAPKIYYSYGDDIFDNLKLWKKYHDAPSKYNQIKFLAKEIKNYVNNSRNFQIQSLAASMMNRACININRELKRLGLNARIVAQIHDQIIVEVPEHVADRCKKMVQYLMENTYKISIKLKAPAAIGTNFYDAH